MHEAREAEIPAVLLAVAIIVVVLSVFILQRAKATAARKVEIRKLQRYAAEEAARVEEEAAEEFSSMLATSSSFPNGDLSSISNPHVTPQNLPAANTPVVRHTSSSNHLSTNPGVCAICSTPTKKQCSRCKAVKYCSQQCQVQHWREGHKQECHELEKRSISSVTAVRVVSNSEDSRHSVKDDNLETNGISREASLLIPLKTSRTLVSTTTDGSLPKPNKILFPYDRFVEYFTWDRLKLPPCGLINCGNSCFANVVLQCLTYTRPLAAYLLQRSHTDECQRNDWCFMCELQDHVARVRENQVPFSPIRILSQIRNIGNHLGYGRQEDAHEFMRFAIDSMQSICLDEVGGEKVVDQRTQETTFIQHIFGGHLQSQVKCMQCQHKSHRYENMMDLAVEIQGNVETLENALTQFTAPEWLDGENKYKCDRCNAYVKAWKRLVVHESPNVLTIALKRFQTGKFGKLNKRVSFPEVLDMSPYMSEDSDKKMPYYQLYGVVVHVDMLNASFFGHYICYVKDLHGSWYKIDDSKVKETDLDKVMQQRAYMLFYTRSVPRPAPTVGDGGMRPSIIAHINSCNFRRTELSNGNHALPESSVFSNEANGNGSISYISESNGVLSSGSSNILT